MPPNFRPQKTKVYAPACSIYLSTQYNSVTNQSFPPIIPFFLTPKFLFPHPKVPFFLFPQHIFPPLTPIHHLLWLHSAFASPSSSLHPFFIPSFPFLEALVQEELTNSLIKGEYTANLQRTQRQKIGKLGLGWNEEESLNHWPLQWAASTINWSGLVPKNDLNGKKVVSLHSQIAGYWRLLKF